MRPDLDQHNTDGIKHYGDFRLLVMYAMMMCDDSAGVQCHVLFNPEKEKKKTPHT